MTNQSFEATESRLRAALHELAENHRPDTDRHWPASHPRGERRPDRPSPTRRWLLAAASIVVVLAGIAAVAVVQGDSDEPSTDLAPIPSPDTVPESDDDPLPTTAPTAPPNSVPATVPAEELTGMRFPVDAAEQEAGLLPWGDGFLAVTVDPPDGSGGDATIRASFTADGSSWEPVEVSTPPGLQVAGRISSVGDRLVIADSVSTADGGVVVRVASTTDLRNWSAQDFELPGAQPLGDQSQLGVWWPSMRSFAVNETGWVFEIVRMYSADVTSVLPGDLQRDLVAGTYKVRSDDAGFTVAVNGPDGSPPTPESTYSYTWDEVGVAAEDVPYLTGEVPISQTWAATWDGTATVGQTAMPTGMTMASPAGFVRWNDRTWFSSDGLTWSPSPLPDPTGTVTSAFPVDNGFVAIVANQRGTSDVYLLDERGGNPRQISVDELDEQFAKGLADRTSTGFGSTPSSPSSAAVLTIGPSVQMPLVIESGGYRYIERRGLSSVVDLATGDVVMFYSRERPPAADTTFVFGDDGLTVTDPDTETVLMQVPIETYQAARDEAQALTGSPEDGDAVSAVRLIASRDGQRFLVEPLPSSDPDTDVNNPVAGVATNGRFVLARLGNEWIRYELPS
ncbi:MAG TPA: hypothetical protein VK860_09975 [Ilumatobacteraceae bacterium]|nr:hypothetical protein [Ilumatobacteraceae bacterium]